MLKYFSLLLSVCHVPSQITVLFSELLANPIVAHHAVGKLSLDPDGAHQVVDPDPDGVHQVQARERGDMVYQEGRKIIMVAYNMIVGG